MKISENLKKLCENLERLAINVIGDANNTLGSAFGTQNKYLNWAKINNYKIEKLEFSSYLEAGFSFWEVKGGHSCVKTILIYEHNSKIGAYLMGAIGHDMQVKFVPVEELKFKNPIIDRVLKTKFK